MNNKKILLVGAGISNAVIATQLKDKNKITVIDSRNIIGGNCTDSFHDNIMKQEYGPHIFHTSNKKIYDFVCQYCEMIPYNHQVITSEGYNLPFNMNTFSKLFNTISIEEVKKIIENERLKIDSINNIKEPKNLEEQALSTVGKTIYEKFIKYYTQKQWNRDCKELSKDIIKRIPIRYTFDNSYYNDKYVGIPKEGFSKMIENMFKGCEIKLNTKFSKDMEKDYDIIFYSGKIDEYYNYCFGKLDYRTVSWKSYWKDTDNYQGCSVMNFCGNDVDFTRRIEWKHFGNSKENTFGNSKECSKTLISEEYPNDKYENKIDAYPINDSKNKELYEKYKNIKNNKVKFVGRLGLYEYLDIDRCIEKCINMLKIINKPCIIDYT